MSYNNQEHKKCTNNIKYNVLGTNRVRRVIETITNKCLIRLY